MLPASMTATGRIPVAAHRTTSSRPAASLTANGRWPEGQRARWVASSIDWSAAGAGGAQVDVAAPGSAGRGGECLDADIGAGVGGVNHHRLAVPDAGVDPDIADPAGGP